MSPGPLFIYERNVFALCICWIRELVSRIPFDLGLSLTTMPGHDHTLRVMFHPDSLSNSAMVLNWICPVTDGESDIFSTLNR